MSTSKNPWLDIPLADYEQHMALPENGQAQMLAKELGAVVEECHPKSVAIIGCAGGNGFKCLLGHGLERVVGVDINPTYIDTFRRRCRGAFSKVESYVADIQLDELRFPPVDLVFVALVFEFVDLDKTIKALRPLCLPGGCFAVVLQLANPSLEAVTPSPYTSLQKLAPILRLLEPEVFVSSAQASGFTLEGDKHLELPSGKQFCRLTFRASSRAKTHLIT